MFARYCINFFSAIALTAFFTVSFVSFFYLADVLSLGSILNFFKYEYYSQIIVALFFIIIGYVAHASIFREFQRKTRLAEKDASVWKKAILEQSSGYHSLMKAIEEYEKYYDDELAGHLATKKHPALKSADIVRDVTKERREARYELRVTKALIDYYESIAPFLLDFKDEIIDAGDDQKLLADYTEEERADPLTNYLTKQEYRKLPSVKRNQMALDRFWQRPKSRRLVGRLYERYVGYLYEQRGYKVDYIGIYKGYEDLGRDLICIKGRQILIIQCKNWSQFKTIYEKHIFQFFGTVFQYKDSNPNREVRGIFYTTTQVSDLSRRFAEELDIELVENHVFDKSYPCIKCNINQSTKEKIYHLPFDQMYDKTDVDRKGEFYCKTVEEAESKGFRRAYRWKGNK